jgi:hypothetical protein
MVAPYSERRARSMSSLMSTCASLGLPRSRWHGEDPQAAGVSANEMPGGRQGSHRYGYPSLRLTGPTGTWGNSGKAPSKCS